MCLSDDTVTNVLASTKPRVSCEQRIQIQAGPLIVYAVECLLRTWLQRSLVGSCCWPPLLCIDSHMHTFPPTSTQGPLAHQPWCPAPLFDSCAQVAIKVIDLLCMPQPARQALLKGLKAMVQAAAGCPAVCCFEGVCMRGEQLLLVMKQYSSSLGDVLSKQTGVS